MNFYFLSKNRNKYIFALVIVILVILSIYFFSWRPPGNFPLGNIYTVEEGKGLSQTATELKKDDIIRSEFLFKSSVVLLAGSKGLRAGDYALTRKQGTLIMAYRLTHSDYELEPVRITIREGLNVFEIADILAEKLSKLDKDRFITLASEKEGYLFPDTYYFLPNSSSETIINALTQNFNKKILPLREQIKDFAMPLADIIKMASIVEEEARTMEDKKIVAGILWKRISLNMPLQVDASFKYINGKITKNLLLVDLKIDSPYNSYLYKGLPPTPIANPGLNSILATIEPTETKDIYFLSDRNGDMHYAITYDEHLQNKKIYLE